MAVVPATRRSIAVPQPRRTPAQDPKTTRGRRPQLRVVDEPASRRLNLGVVTTLVVGAVFAVLFGLVVFHTVLLQNQQKLDHLNTAIESVTTRIDELIVALPAAAAPDRPTEPAKPIKANPQAPET